MKLAWVVAPVGRVKGAGWVREVTNGSCHLP